LYNVVPLKIGSYAIYGGQLGLLCGKKEAGMLEAHYISALRIPPLYKFRRSCWGKKSHTVRSEKKKGRFKNEALLWGRGGSGVVTIHIPIGAALQNQSL